MTWPLRPKVLESRAIRFGGNFDSLQRIVAVTIDEAFGRVKSDIGSLVGHAGGESIVDVGFIYSIRSWRGCLCGARPSHPVRFGLERRGDWDNITCCDVLVGILLQSRGLRAGCDGPHPFLRNRQFLGSRC